jgi:hydrogenase-4 component B
MGLFAPAIMGFLHPLVTASVTASGNGIRATFVALPMMPLGITLACTITAIYLTVLRKSPHKFITWDCGFGSANARSQVTSDSFVQPIARIFTPVFRTNVAVEITGKDRRHFPEKIHVEPSMVSLLETRIYGPAGTVLKYISRSVAKLQAGSIHLYLTYVCLALIILLLVGTQIW